MGELKESDSPYRVQRDARTSELLDELASIEDRLDPGPRWSGQRIADLVTLAVIVVATLALDLELRYPALLIALLLVARVSTRIVRSVTDRSLHRERDQLLVGDGDPEEQ